MAYWCLCHNYYRNAPLFHCHDFWWLHFAPVICECEWFPTVFFIKNDFMKPPRICFVKPFSKSEKAHFCTSFLTRLHEKNGEVKSSIFTKPTKVMSSWNNIVDTKQWVFGKLPCMRLKAPTRHVLGVTSSVKWSVISTVVIVCSIALFLAVLNRRKLCYWHKTSGFNLILIIKAALRWTEAGLYFFHTFVHSAL